MAKGEKSKLERTAFNPNKLILGGIEKRFSAFRKSHPPRSMIPIELRKAVLGAIDAGVPSADLRRVCQVSTTQLQYWQAGACKVAANRTAVPREPKIFSVLDNNPPPAPEDANDIELRIGEWEIRICQAAKSARSHSTCCR